VRQTRTRRAYSPALATYTFRNPMYRSTHDLAHVQALITHLTTLLYARIKPL